MDDPLMGDACLTTPIVIDFSRHDHVGDKKPSKEDKIREYDREENAYISTGRGTLAKVSCKLSEK